MPGYPEPRTITPDTGEWPGADAEVLRVIGGANLAELLERATVTITGSRACTAYGEFVARDYASALEGHAATLVTGLSYGIEEAAVEGALMAGVPIVVILGGSIDPDKHYPPRLTALREKVVESGGLLVSPFGDDSYPTRSLLIQRNRAIGNASDVAVIAESSVRGGAMLIAETVAEAGRHVLAAPTNITSGLSGTNRLIKSGVAKMTTSSDDMIAALSQYAGSEW